MLAQRLKQLRTEKSINQIRLAQEMGVTQGTVGKWETNKRTPDTDMLRKLSSFFNVTVDYLLGGEPELVLLTRKLAGLPEENRKQLLRQLDDTIEDYLKSAK